MNKHTGDLWQAFQGTKLWQVQIEHEARPSIAVGMVSAFNDFLKEMSRASPGTPDSLPKLQADAGIKLVLTNTEDMLLNINTIE